MNFIQSIKAGTPSVEAHKNLLRFGKGTFDREQIVIRKTKQLVDVTAGFEYYLAFYRIFLSLSEGPVSSKGIIIGPKQQMQQVLEDMNIQPSKVFGKKFTIDHVGTAEELLALADRAESTSGHLLLSLKNTNLTLTAKSAFPKPGKLVEKFCRLKIPVAHAKLVTDALMIPDFEKKATIDTVYDITRIHFDEKLLTKDPARARLESKREVEVKRTITIDATSSVESFSAVV
jgi:hypothetical protein